MSEGGINRLVPHNTKQDVDPRTKRGVDAGERKKIYKKEKDCNFRH